MRNIAFLLALVISLGLIVYLYLQLATAQESLRQAERRYTDCEKVTFQLQNQLTAQQRGATTDSPR
ncbi:hypothetical protein SAMN00120144_1686 [Hymenobacter roseosalivarius DSM 11622]|uniref:Uncharacterized protein n=1 Tax=Hymenobacter roseosalivarius DSM 11622 TaxID=645990 RepID=A0A1W1W3T5_9BACT|nr:hypothetical protein [Hymenobacter roseosalivarius]SMC00256.1 hypothetical protein SAMN00120144_1686 [Hymenobacter roseosalivarius DSM 11622]